MNNRVYALNTIRSIESGKKAHMPVSIAAHKSDSTFIVSHYGDDVWDFWPMMPRENLMPSQKRINWAYNLPDSRMLTDPEHSGILESAKDFIYSLFTEPIEGRKRPKMMTVIYKYEKLKPLLRYMVEKKLTSFEELDGYTINYVPYAKLSNNGGGIKPREHAKRLAILEDIYLQREKMADALQVHPWPNESAYSLAGFDQKRVRRPKTILMPERIAKAIAASALDYVQNKSQKLLSDMEKVQKVRADSYNNAVKCNSKRNVKRHALRSATSAAKKLGYKNFTELDREIVLLSTACYIVIDFFTGMRNSEVLSLDRGCTFRRKSIDGICELTWIHGTIYKKASDAEGHPKEWLAPSVAEDAINVMERLSASVRDKLKAEETELNAKLEYVRKKLFQRLKIVRRQSNKLFFSKETNNNNFCVLSALTMGRRLKEFCKYLNIIGDDGKPWPLASHQFRRNFAHFVAKSDLGDLNQLREHFGHWSIEMTMLYADGALDEKFDSDLCQDVIYAKNDYQYEIIKNHTLGKEYPILANGNWLRELRNEVRTAKNKEEIIRQYSDMLTLTGTGHSWCVGSAEEHSCGGLCVFEAEMCVDCRHGIIGQEHLLVWKGIAEQNRQAIDIADLGIPGKALAKKRLDKALEVIAILEGGRNER